MAEMCVTLQAQSGHAPPAALNGRPCSDDKAHILAHSDLVHLHISGSPSCRYEAGGLLATDDSGIGVIAGSTLGGGTSTVTPIRQLGAA